MRPNRPCALGGLFSQDLRIGFSVELSDAVFAYPPCDEPAPLPPLRPPRRLFAPMLVAALLGGGLARGSSSTAGTSDQQAGRRAPHDRRVSASRPLAAVGRQRENVSSGLTAADISSRSRAGAWCSSAPRSSSRPTTRSTVRRAPQKSEGDGLGIRHRQQRRHLTNNHVIDGRHGRLDHRPVRRPQCPSRPRSWAGPSTDLAPAEGRSRGLALMALPLGSSKDSTSATDDRHRQPVRPGPHC
jgi:hypothetical protein